MELLVVIAILSILMTVGAIGLGNIGGKGVSNAVSTSEAVFDEARSIAVGKRTNARVMVAKDLIKNPANNLRLVIVAYQEPDPTTGEPSGDWTLVSRGTVLPEGVFFSQTFSSQNHTGGGGAPPIMDASGFSAAYRGTYYYYEFNSEGICTTPGASFVVGSGVRAMNDETGFPRTTASAKRDFGGFVIWRNGRSSVFRSPEQIGISRTVTTF